MGEAEKKIRELGLVLAPRTEIRTPVYEKAKRVGDQAFVAAHGPQDSQGRVAFTGRLGIDLTIDEGYEAARLCALDCLASLKVLLGTLDKISQVVMVRGFVNSADGFFDQPKVMNGASEVLIDIFGDRGRHSRTAIGVPVLPRNLAVVVDMQVDLVSD